jgi:ribosomal protein L29
MKLQDIRKLSTEDLTKQSNELREEIAADKRKINLGELNNVRTVRTKRKDLARVLTVLGEQLTKEAQ